MRVPKTERNLPSCHPDFSIHYNMSKIGQRVIFIQDSYRKMSKDISSTCYTKANNFIQPAKTQEHSASPSNSGRQNY
jgi:hypothetical protein